MKILILILSLFLISANLFGQSDSLTFGESVKKMVTDEKSDFYYPNLLQKLNSNNLSETDFFYLYYGQLYTADYSALKALTHPQTKNFMRLVQKGNCQKALPLGIEIINENPVDLTTLIHTCNCIKTKNLPDQLNLVDRFNKLLITILSSGDGKTMETAIKIANLQDDYVIKGVLGFIGGQESLAMNGKRGYSVWTFQNQKLYFEDIINVKLPK